MEIHPAGKAFCLSNPIPIQGFNVQVLNGYCTSEEYRREEACYVHNLPILLMPVRFSPVYALFRYDPRNSWLPLYTDSLKMISVLKTIYNCYNQPVLSYFEQHEQRIMEARTEYDQKIEKLQEEIENGMIGIQNANLNERQTLEQFLVFLEHVTMTIIHNLETALIKMFGIQNPMLTPVEFPDASVLSEKEIALIPAIYCHFFETKQEIMNVRLERALPEGTQYEKKQFFNINEMATRLRTSSPDEIYKGYIDRITAWEYYQFMKITQ